MNTSVPGLELRLIAHPCNGFKALLYTDSFVSFLGFGVLRFNR